MQKEDRKPKFIIVYKCTECGTESGLSDIEEPQCHYCDATTGLTVVSKEVITPELIAARLKASTDNMMKALREAYELMPKDQGAIGESEEDEEKQFLELMARAQQFTEKVQALDLKTPEEE